jgi:hypothetical protein
LFRGQEKEEADTFCLQRTIQGPILVSSEKVVLQGALPLHEPTGMQQLSRNMWVVLEAISKMWIRLEGKARGGEKAQHTREYVSILSRPVTPPSSLRRVFEIASNVPLSPVQSQSHSVLKCLETRSKK